MFAFHAEEEGLQREESQCYRCSHDVSFAATLWLGVPQPSLLPLYFLSLSPRLIGDRAPGFSSVRIAWELI